MILGVSLPILIIAVSSVILSFTALYGAIRYFGISVKLLGAVVGVVVSVGGWTYLFAFAGLPEHIRALLLVGLLAAILGVVCGILMYWIFYKPNRVDIHLVDPRGDVIGHRGVAVEMVEQARLVGGNELPYRRDEDTNARSYLVKSWYFKDAAPPIFVVPPEKALPPDVAWAHVGKVREMHEELEKDSQALDLLEHSLNGMLRKAYRKGKAHAMIAQESLEDAGDLALNTHNWIKEKEEEVHQEIEDFQEESLEESDKDEESEEENGVLPDVEVNINNGQREG